VGEAPGAQVALTSALSGASDAFTVRAKLYQDDVLIDDVSVQYCSPLETPCPTSNSFVVVVIGGIIVILIIGATMFLRKKKSPIETSTPRI
jgi:hypothetical protein